MQISGSNGIALKRLLAKLSEVFPFSLLLKSLHGQPLNIRVKLLKHNEACPCNLCFFSRGKLISHGFTSRKKSQKQFDLQFPVKLNSLCSSYVRHGFVTWVVSPHKASISIS